MRESKAELTDRLRREGRWEDFKRRREALKAQGMPPSDAWAVVADEFPALETKQPGGAARTVDLRALKGKPAVSVVQAAAWAFEHLDTDWIEPADAPSAGAWSMREWARSSMTARSEFYRTFVAKLVLPPQEEAREAEEAAEAHNRELHRRLFGDLKPDPEADRAAEEMFQRTLHGED